MDSHHDQKIQGSPATATDRLAVVGAGKMGGTLVRALIEAGSYRPEDVVATVGHEASVAPARERLGVEVTTDNRSAVCGAGLVLLCVRPQLLRRVLDDIGSLVQATWSRCPSAPQNAPSSADGP